MLAGGGFQANLRRFGIGAISLEQLQRRDTWQSVGPDVGQFEFLDPLRSGAIARRPAAVSGNSAGRIAYALNLQPRKSGPRQVAEQYRIRKGSCDAGAKRQNGAK